MVVLLSQKVGIIHIIRILCADVKLDDSVRVVAELVIGYGTICGYKMWTEI
jgi:hypothetical protein